MGAARNASDGGCVRYDGLMLNQSEHPSNPRFSGRIPRLLIAVFLLAGASLVFWPLLKQAPAGLTFYGNVDIREVDLAFRQAGRLSRMAFEEGDSVAAGAELATLDAGPFEQRRQEAEALLDEASANLQRLTRGFRPQEIAQSAESLKYAEATLAYSEQELLRQQAAVHSGATTRQTLDQARTARDQALASVQTARADLSLKREGYRIEEIDAARARQQSAKARLAEAETALEDTRLVAPSSGTIQARIKEPGSMINQSTPVYTLSLLSPAYVRAYVSELDLAKAVPGTAVTLSCDSCSRSYHGTLGFVSPRAEFTPKSVETTDLRTDLVYRVRITVQDPDAGLRHGMPVSIVMGTAP